MCKVTLNIDIKSGKSILEQKINRIEENWTESLTGDGLMRQNNAVFRLLCELGKQKFKILSEQSIDQLVSVIMYGIVFAI